MKQISVRVDEDSYRFLKAISEASGYSISSIISDFFREVGKVYIDLGTPNKITLMSWRHERLDGKKTNDSVMRIDKIIYGSIPELESLSPRVNEILADKELDKTIESAFKVESDKGKVVLDSEVHTQRIELKGDLKTKDGRILKAEDGC